MTPADKNTKTSTDRHQLLFLLFQALPEIVYVKTSAASDAPVYAGEYMAAEWLCSSIDALFITVNSHLNCQ
jgi:hypothetical protein